MENAIELLRAFVQGLPPGPVENISELTALLSAAWDEFENDDGSLKDYKLWRRLEDVIWDTPCIRFTIERHGAMHCGSSRAELQDWQVNIETSTACHSTGRYRQKCPKLQGLKTKPLAERISKLIISQSDSPELKWDENKTSVKVLIGTFIPATFVSKQTLTGQRRRFKKHLTDYLVGTGWVLVRANHYQYINQKQA
jgi:hypothetical protein